MQSAFHNLPTINGMMQKEGAEYRAKNVKVVPGKNDARFSLDLASAYPKEAAVDRWDRTLTLNRGGSGAVSQVELVERYALRQWREAIRLNFITPLRAAVSTPGVVGFEVGTGGGASFVMTYDAGKFTAAVEELPLADVRLRESWGERLARVVLTQNGQAMQSEHTIVLRYAK